MNNKEDISSLKNVCVSLHRGKVWPKILGDSQMSPTGYLWTWGLKTLIYWGNTTISTNFLSFMLPPSTYLLRIKLQAQCGTRERRATVLAGKVLAWSRCGLRLWTPTGLSRVLLGSTQSPVLLVTESCNRDPPHWQPDNGSEQCGLCKWQNTVQMLVVDFMKSNLPSCSESQPLSSKVKVYTRKVKTRRKKINEKHP